MIRSMTGYGRGSASSSTGAVTVEVRSVNHRFLDISLRLPEELSTLEERLRQRVKLRAARGRVTVTVSFQRPAEQAVRVRTDLEMAQRTMRALRRVRRELKLEDPVRLEHVLSVSPLVTTERIPLDPRKASALITKALERALVGLVKSRLREGQALARDVSKRAQRISTLVQQIERRGPVVVGQYRKRLKNRLRELADGRGLPDPAHLDTECLLFAKNSDIAEELIRLASHLEAFRSSIKRRNEVGRHLDFLAQEMGREINTVCQKANDYRISAWGVEVKGALDKIREQVQNIE